MSFPERLCCTSIVVFLFCLRLTLGHSIFTYRQDHGKNPIIQNSKVILAAFSDSSISRPKYYDAIKLPNSVQVTEAVSSRSQIESILG